MKDKVMVYVALAVVFILVCAVGSGYWNYYRMYREVMKDNRELRNELAQVTVKPEQIIIRDSIEVVKQKIVEVDKTDYKKLLADKELINELNLKVSQIEAENRSLLATMDSVMMTKINDSVYTYKDKWAEFEFYVTHHKLNYSVRDSITTVIARQYKHKFLWFKWGTKGYDVYVVSHNPHAKVEWNKYIKVKK